MGSLLVKADVLKQGRACNPATGMDVDITLDWENPQCRESSKRVTWKGGFDAKGSIEPMLWF